MAPGVTRRTRNNPTDSPMKGIDDLPPARRTRGAARQASAEAEADKGVAVVVPKTKAAKVTKKPAAKKAAPKDKAAPKKKAAPKTTVKKKASRSHAPSPEPSPEPQPAWQPETEEEDIEARVPEVDTAATHKSSQEEVIDVDDESTHSHPQSQEGTPPSEDTNPAQHEHQIHNNSTKKQRTTSLSARNLSRSLDSNDPETQPEQVGASATRSQHIKHSSSSLMKPDREDFPVLSALINAALATQPDPESLFHVHIGLQLYPHFGRAVLTGTQLRLEGLAYNAAEPSLGASDISSLEDSPTDNTGSKRKRNAAETDTPRKRSKDHKTIITYDHGQYYEDGDLMATPSAMDKARAIHVDEERSRNADVDDAGVDDDQDADNSPFRPASNSRSRRGKSRASASTNKSPGVASPDDEQTHEDARATPAPTPSRGFLGSVGSSLSRIIGSPLSFLGRSPARGSIPNFTAPPIDTGNVSRPLFTSDKKSPRKASKPNKTSKVSRTKRQEASNYQVDLSKRKAAAQAIAQSQTMAEDIEAEIARRVEEEIQLRLQADAAITGQSSQQVTKRKRVSSDGDGPETPPHKRVPPDNVETEPGSTPHPHKSATSLLKAGSVNAPSPPHTGGYGLPDDFSDDESISEPKAKRVKFSERTESLTTPEQGSQLARQQARRPPGGSLFSMGLESGPYKGIIKTTNYDWNQMYDPDHSFNYGSEPSLLEQDIDRPHDFGVKEFNLNGSFGLNYDETYFSDEESDDDDDAELPGPAGSTPMPKKTADRLPPAAPQPSHAVLPSVVQSTPTQSDAITAARARANQYTPKQPSRLRESTNIAPPPPPAAAAVTSESDALRPQSPPRISSTVAREVLEFVRRERESPAGDENTDPAILDNLKEFANEQHKLVETSRIDSVANDAFEAFWVGYAADAVAEIEAGFSEWRRDQSTAQSTGLGF